MKLIFCLAITFALFVNPALSQRTTVDCADINFHYLITSDAQDTSVSRSVEVFLDNAAFSEKNLKILFAHLAKRYSRTKILIITVVTNWEQLPLPADCRSAGISDLSTKPENFEYHEARYFRNQETEFFTYNPVLKTEDFKKVLLRKK